MDLHAGYAAATVYGPIILRSHQPRSSRSRETRLLKIHIGDRRGDRYSVLYFFDPLCSATHFVRMAVSSSFFTGLLR